MNGEKRCRDYCTIVAEYRCCYECEKNQECDNYNVSKCYNCDISKQNDYKTITDRHGRITEVGKVKEEQEIKYLCNDKCSITDKNVCCRSCNKYDTCKDKNELCANYVSENMSCKSNEMSAKSKEKKEENNKTELIISNSEKAIKLLKIECILRDCTIDDLIVNLISDKAKAIYDNVVDNK